jgi:hypothetical protein
MTWAWALLVLGIRDHVGVLLTSYFEFDWSCDFAY